MYPLKVVLEKLEIHSPCPNEGWVSNCNLYNRTDGSVICLQLNFHAHMQCLQRCWTETRLPEIIVQRESHITFHNYLSQNFTEGISRGNGGLHHGTILIIFPNPEMKLALLADLYSSVILPHKTRKKRVRYTGVTSPHFVKLIPADVMYVCFPLLFHSFSFSNPTSSGRVPLRITREGIPWLRI